MFVDYSQLELFPVTLSDFLGNMFIALICGIIISIVYRYVYNGSNYSRSFVNSLVLLTLITSVVLLVIGNNLARAFGLVGAMSIIRFRTAVKDTQDIVFIFFCLAIGMATGVGMNLIAVVATGFISLVVIGLYKTNLFESNKKQYLLQLSYQGEEHISAEIDSVLKKHCKAIKIISLKTVGYDDEQEAFYNFELRNKEGSETFVAALKKIDGVSLVNIFFDQDDFNAPTDY